MLFPLSSDAFLAGHFQRDAVHVSRAAWAPTRGQLQQTCALTDSPWGESSGAWFKFRFRPLAREFGHVATFGSSWDSLSGMYFHIS